MEEEKNIEFNLKKRYKLTLIMFGMDCIIVLLGIIYSSKILSYLSNFESPLISETNLYIVLALYLVFSTFLAYKTYTNLKKRLN